MIAEEPGGKPFHRKSCQDRRLHARPGRRGSDFLDDAGAGKALENYGAEERHGVESEAVPGESSQDRWLVAETDGP